MVAGLRVLGFWDYFSAASAGGAERVALEVYRRLARWGAEVTVVTASPRRLPPIEVDGVRVLSVPALDLTRLTQAQVAVSPQLYSSVLRVGDAFGADVLHANGLHFQTSLAAAYLSRRRRIPLVTTVHVAGLDALAAHLRWACATYEGTLGRMVLSSSAQVIAVSQSVRRHLGRLRVPQDRLSVVGNGVDHRRFYPAVTLPREGPLRIVFIGRLIPNKGPLVLIRALAKLARAGVAFEAALLGDGPLRHQIERLLVRSSLTAQVRLLGHVTDVAEHLRDADVCIRPSFTEGMPLAVLEAMACGVCVVASDVEGNAELISHGDTGLLFPAGDDDALATRILWALEHPEVRRRIGEHGQRSSLPHTWDECAERHALTLASMAVRTGR